MNYNEIAELAHDAVLLTLMINDDSHGGAWKTTSDGKNVSHAIEHLRKYLAGDTSENHIYHAITRITLILAKKQFEEMEPIDSDPDV
jgi:hypothetical protein